MSARGFALVVVAALVLGGATAIAGPDALRKAVTKSQVKKISAKQVKKLAPGLADARITAREPSLSVAEAGSAADADRLDGKDSSEFAAAASEAPHIVGSPGEPAFQNGWNNVGAPNVTSSAGFYKDPLGVVHLQGIIFAGADNTVAYTLPTGYRPAVELLLPLGTLAPPEGAGMTVQADGDVVLDCEGASCSNAGMDGLSFRVP